MKKVFVIARVWRCYRDREKYTRLDPYDDEKYNTLEEAEEALGKKLEKKSSYGYEIGVHTILTLYTKE